MARWNIRKPDQEEIPQEEGLLGRAKRVGIGAGVKALESIEGALPPRPRFEDLESEEGLKRLFGPGGPGIAGLKVTQAQNPSEVLKEKYNLTPEYLEPQGTIESGIQKFAQAAPLTAGFAHKAGANVAQALKPALKGAAASALSEKLGAPPILQDIVQFGTEYLSGRHPSIKETKRVAEDLMRSAVKPTEQHTFTNTATALGNTINELSTTGQAIQKDVKNALKPVFANLKKSEGNPIKLVDVRKWLGKEIYKWPNAQRLSFGEPIREAITKDLIEYGQKNPKFLDNFNKRNQLTVYEYMKAPITDYITQFPGINKVMSPKYVSLLEHPEKIIRSFWKLPAARNVFGDMALAAIENNPDRFVRSANQFKQFIPELAHEEEQLESPMSKWNIRKQ